MKATGPNLRRVGDRRLGFLLLEILGTCVGLILDNSDVSRGRRWRYFLFGCLGQLFELTLLPTSLEWATP